MERVNEYTSDHLYGYNSIDIVMQMVHDLKMNHGIGSALMIDIEGAYDNVDPEKLIHVLQDLDLPPEFIQWTAHFTSSRTTSLISHYQHTTSLMEVSMGIPQGSASSPLCFLLFTTGHQFNERIT
ncbi:unnamed protein product [Ambrosiozyma monospora]|uniref:Unnamed protein product n=1 Tax=Ambrosiozyma monospora TaxID=43982 RepID=A0A9W7DH67_AMBMO|nr:unnamed protein product [Ambrosiozyma monospora]